MNRLPACRVCLAYDTRLCSIMDGQLRYVYETLVEASLDTEDILPTAVCFICFALLKKMLKFRDRSQKANQILKQMISSGLQPSVSSLDMLVKDQTGMSWTLGISNIERTTTGGVEIDVKIESVKSEMDIDRMSDQNEDYPDAIPEYKDSTDSEDDFPIQNKSIQCNTDPLKVNKTPKVYLRKRSGYEDYPDAIPEYKDSTDSEDDFPIQNKSIQCNTDPLKVNKTPKVYLRKRSGYEGAGQPEKRKLDQIKAENEPVNVQAPFIKTEKDEEPREKKRDKRKVSDLNNRNKNFKGSLKTIWIETETTTSNIISKKHNESAIIKNDSVTPPKVIFTCDLCKNEYQSKAFLETHLKKSHVIELDRNESSIKLELKVKNECKSSNVLERQELQNDDNLTEANERRKYIKKLSKGKQYQCSYCMKRFTRNSDLSTHLRIHTEQNLYKCNIKCEKGFSQGSHLTRHDKMHTKEKPFECDICEKYFTFKEDLTSHLRIHTKEKTFMCDICGKDFSQSSHLKRHYRVHTKEKPYKCDVCEKYFSQNSNLTKHLRTHSDEKSYSCSYCNKRFATRQKLESHLRNHAKENH